MCQRGADAPVQQSRDFVRDEVHPGRVCQASASAVQQYAILHETRYIPVGCVKRSADAPVRVYSIAVSFKSSNENAPRSAHPHESGYIP